jgi:putative tricarboxylic transport membrane protein
MEDRNMPKADFAASIILMAFGTWIVVHSINMPRFKEFGANPFSVPGIVPGILGTIITTLSLLVFIRAVRQRGYKLGVSGHVLKSTVQDASFKRMIITCSVCILYGLGMVGAISYYLATFIYIFAFLIIFQYRLSETTHNQKKLIGWSVVQALLIAGTVGVVFRYLFLVDLP